MFARSLIAVVALAGLASTASAVNLLGNPGFEDPITTDGPPFIGSWEGFNAGVGSQAINSTVSPRTGAQSADVSIFGVDNAFAGVFQDVMAPAGSSVTFSGFHKTTTTALLGVATEIRIEWRSETAEISRTPNTTTVPTTAYSEFSVSAVVPAGADRGRFVYAIQTFGGEPNPGNNGTVLLDDMSVVIVPEPTTLALAAGVFGLARRRR